MKILIIGPVGSGKSTQAEILSEKLDYPHIQTGELIRHRAAQDDAMGHMLQRILHVGELAPDKIVAELFKEQVNDKENYISDTYPRRLSQLSVYDPGIELAIYLNVPDEILVERLLARKRPDDVPEVIRKRLHVYHTETEPLLEHYHNQSKLVLVDASGNLESVTKNILQKLQEFKDFPHHHFKLD